MKKFYIVISLIFTFFKINAQSGSVTTKGLDVPSSPGFILMDVAPSSIDPANSPKAFALNFFNQLVETNTIPKNLAIQFSPFWFIKSKNMTVYKYLGFDVPPGKMPDSTSKVNPFAMLKLANLSMATISNTDSATKKPLNNYSVGVQFNLLRIYKKNYVPNLLKSLKGITAAQTAGAANCFSAGGNMADCIENSKGMKEAQEGVFQALAAKPTFSIDGALAVYYFDLNGTGPKFGRFGAWLTYNLAANLTPTRNLSNNYLNFTLLTRYISDATLKDTKNNYLTKNYFDSGGKLTFDFSKISLAYEFIYRNDGSNNNYRSAGIVKYKLKENLYIQGSFGRNFGTSAGLISFFGVNWGLSNNESMTLPPI